MSSTRAAFSARKAADAAPPIGGARGVPFHPATVLKTDVFGWISKGRLGGQEAIERDLSRARWWAWPVAALLFRREVKALRRLAGLPAVPQLLRAEPDRLYRSYLRGAPMHVARPLGNAAYFRAAKAALRAIHRRGVTHNDLAKQQNWLVGEYGQPLVIDLQLACVHRRRGKLFRLLAYEDLRHLLKHKRRYVPEALTATEKRVLARKSLPTRIWMATGKRLYNAITRGIFRWSDGEGGHDRLRSHGPALEGFLAAQPGVRAVVVSSYPYPRRIAGLYAFVEGEPWLDEPALARAARATLGCMAAPDLVQLARRLPRDAEGAPRRDVLDLVARNLVDDALLLAAGDADAAVIVAGRLNRSDRK